MSRGMQIAIGVIAFLVFLDVAFLSRFIYWRQKRIHELGLTHCSICGGFGRICHRDTDGEFPRCFECCDHTKNESERE